MKILCCIPCPIVYSFKGRQLLISLMSNDTTEEFLRIAVPTLARLAVKSHIEIAETVLISSQILHHYH